MVEKRHRRSFVRQPRLSSLQIQHIGVKVRSIGLLVVVLIRMATVRLSPKISQTTGPALSGRRRSTQSNNGMQFWKAPKNISFQRWGQVRTGSAKELSVLPSSRSAQYCPEAGQVPKLGTGIPDVFGSDIDHIGRIVALQRKTLFLNTPRSMLCLTFWTSGRWRFHWQRLMATVLPRLRLILVI